MFTRKSKSVAEGEFNPQLKTFHWCISCLEPPPSAFSSYIRIIDFLIIMLLKLVLSSILVSKLVCTRMRSTTTTTACTMCCIQWLAKLHVTCVFVFLADMTQTQGQNIRRGKNRWNSLDMVDWWDRRNRSAREAKSQIKTACTKSQIKTVYYTVKHRYQLTHRHLIIKNCNIIVTSIFQRTCYLKVLE